MFNWKNILKGLIGALVICGVTYLLIVVIFPSWYGEASAFFWGNAIVLFTFLAVIVAYFMDLGSTRKIQKETKDRYSRISWDHPQKIKYYTSTRILYWVGIWGILIYMLLYALDLVTLDIDSISALISVWKA